jgi:hypothetical protein
LIRGAGQQARSIGTYPNFERNSRGKQPNFFLKDLLNVDRSLKPQR